MSNTRRPHSPTCSELKIMAERELTAFLGAVTRLHGAEQAEMSAEVWLDELQELDNLPKSTNDWRAVTVAALARLADRLTAAHVSLIPSSKCSATAERFWLSPA